MTVRRYGTMINQKLYDIQNCNEYVRYSANSGATWTNWLPTIERFVQVVARHGGDQAIAANVTTKIEFNGFYHKSIFISDEFGWSTTNYNFVVPFTGLYKFEFSINLTASTAITTSPKICTYVYNNNSIIQNKGTNWISGISNRINDTYVIYAQQGNVIDFRIEDLIFEKLLSTFNDDNK